MLLESMRLEIPLVVPLFFLGFGVFGLYATAQTLERFAIIEGHAQGGETVQREVTEVSTRSCRITYEEPRPDWHDRILYPCENTYRVGDEVTIVRVDDESYLRGGIHSSDRNLYFHRFVAGLEIASGLLGLVWLIRMLLERRREKRSS